MPNACTEWKHSLKRPTAHLAAWEAPAGGVTFRPALAHLYSGCRFHDFFHTNAGRRVGLNPVAGRALHALVAALVMLTRCKLLVRALELANLVQSADGAFRPLLLRAKLSPHLTGPNVQDNPWIS